MTDLTCLALDRSQKPSGPSDSELLTYQVLEALGGVGKTDDEGRMVTVGEVGGGVATGNEDGAHNVIAPCNQGLADVGFTIPASAVTYWVGEDMSSVDFGDLDEVPDAVAAATATMASNLAHIARLLHDDPFPSPS